MTQIDPIVWFAGADRDGRPRLHVVDLDRAAREDPP